MLILVDETDTQIGVAEKIAAHEHGQLHRAFSILTYNNKGEMLLQQRALSKYHAGGLWSNTCCGHPNPGETIEHAIHRRLQEEMGFDALLTKQTAFIYNVPVGNGLTEHEYLHVYAGTYERAIKPNPEEAMATRWIQMEDVREEAKIHPEIFTPWFLLLLEKIP